jgi:hypothetical protein
VLDADADRAGLELRLIGAVYLVQPGLPISTRRFLARPSSMSLVATGCDLGSIRFELAIEAGHAEH